MSDRYTRKDAQAAMERLAAATGYPYYRPSLRGRSGDLKAGVFSGPPHDPQRRGQLWNREGSDNRCFVGAWVLDHNSVYGGYVVEQMENEHGGISHPLGSGRKSAREFCDAVRFALDALRASEPVA